MTRYESIYKGTGGYSDIKPGFKEVVKNEKPEIISLSESGSYSYGGEYKRITCKFPFAVKRLSRANFYSIVVNRRGELTCTPKEPSKKSWKAAFRLIKR